MFKHEDKMEKKVEKIVKIYRKIPGSAFERVFQQYGE